MTGRPRMSLLETVIVALAVAAACAIPAGGVEPSPGQAHEVVVDVPPGEGLTFEPEAIAAPAASLLRVTLRNRSNEAHNLTFQAPIAAETRTIVEAGAEDSVTFVTPGPGGYTFVCTIHIGMSGTLTIE